ncbi:MAG: alpha/beta hydrolase [Asticcacaulis sp.]
MFLNIAAVILLVLAAAYLIGWYITPRPAVKLIRALFNKGAANFSAALIKHVPADIRVQSDLNYDPEDSYVRLDIYSPPDLSPDAPTIVWMHGGGFVSGQRSDIANYLKVLAAQGFAVVNTDYTIAPEATHPAPARQVMQALSYIDTHADSLGLNRHRLVLAGDSAGAHIAAQVAALITSSDYATTLEVAPSIKAEQLKGALLFCGVFDAAPLMQARNPLIAGFMRIMLWAYSGQRNWHEADSFTAHISLPRHLTPAFPPTFISSGNADPLTPQSRLMARALREKGVAVHSLFFPEHHRPASGHEYQFNLDTSDGQKALRETVKWLNNI